MKPIIHLGTSIEMKRNICKKRNLNNKYLQHFNNKVMRKAILVTGLLFAVTLTYSQVSFGKTTPIDSAAVSI